MHRAVRVKPMEQYLLLVEFDNKEIKIFNCFPLVKNNLFSQLTDKNFFKSVHIDEMGLVCWDNATDIEPTELYDTSQSFSEFSFND